jgi:hypothetical protein
VDFLALIIASMTTPALVGAAAVGLIGYWLLGWLGAVAGLIVGYAGGVWFANRFSGVPLSPHIKGWLSLIVFIGGLTLLAIVTR